MTKSKKRPLKRARKSNSSVYLVEAIIGEQTMPFEFYRFSDIIGFLGEIERKHSKIEYRVTKVICPRCR